MGRGLVVLLSGLILGLSLPAEAELPKTLDEVKERHEKEGKTPAGALKVWFDACFVYINEETRDAGREMIQYLTIPLKDNPEWDRLPSQGIFVRVMKGQSYIIQSYAKGTSPENQYEMDPNDYELNVVRINDKHPRALQVYLRSSGADIPRPVYMKQSTATGLWYVYDHANVYIGIRPPKDPNKEEFK